MLAPKDNEILLLIKEETGIPPEFYRHFEFESGEEAIINVGAKTKIIPYYAKLKYLLNPVLDKTPYYVISLGMNYVDGEELGLDKTIDNLGQRINYGIGVGASIGDLEIEILYGRYNYQAARGKSVENTHGYSSTKLSFNCKYRF